MSKPVAFEGPFDDDLLFEEVIVKPTPNNSYTVTAHIVSVEAYKPTVHIDDLFFEDDLEVSLD